MKVLALLLVLAIVSGAYGRSSKVAKVNPHLLHLRIAKTNSNGHLLTAGAALISNTHALTAASVVENSRFIWVRYGVERVPHPELVTETTAYVIHPNFDGTNNDVAIININRHVHYTENIQPIPLGRYSNDASLNADFCGWGPEVGVTELSDTAHCVNLIFADLSLCSVSNDNMICTLGVSSAIESTTPGDEGAPLIQSDSSGNEYIVGILVRTPQNPGSDAFSGVFSRPDLVIDWINVQTGLHLTITNI